MNTTGWAWASVPAIVFRKGKAEDDYATCPLLDNITAAPIKNGRRAELPPEVADWMVAPFAVSGGRFLDPFAGSGAIVKAAERVGMVATGYDIPDAEATCHHIEKEEPAVRKLALRQRPGGCVGMNLATVA